MIYEKISKIIRDKCPNSDKLKALYDIIINENSKAFRLSEDKYKYLLSALGDAKENNFFSTNALNRIMSILNIYDTQTHNGICRECGRERKEGEGCSLFCIDGEVWEANK